MGLFLQDVQNKWKQTHFSTETAHFDQYLNQFLMALHWVPLITRNLIHKYLPVINGTHCN